MNLTCRLLIGLAFLHGTATAQNLLDGGGDFAVNVDGWNVVGTNSLTFSADDAFGNPDSGSALLEADGSIRIVGLIPPQICYPVLYDEYRVFGYFTVLAADAILDGRKPMVTVQRYRNDNCTVADGGAPIPAVVAPTVAEARADWQPMAFVFVPPETTGSFKVLSFNLSVSTGNMPAGTRFAFDELVMEPPALVHADGFESP